MSSIEISNELRNTPPYSRIGLLVATWGDGTQTCGTFSLVGRNDVLTATHLVFDPDKGGKPRSVELYLHADYNQSSSRFDDAGIKIASIDINDIWYQKQTFSEGPNKTLTTYESSYDLAIIGLNTAVGNTYGYLSINPFLTDISGKNASAIGYPTESTGMMSLVVNPTLESYFNWVSQSPDLKPGNSGGPLLVGNSIIGVASAGSDNQAVWAGIKNSFELIAREIALNDRLLGDSSNTQAIIYDYREAASDIDQSFNGYDLDEIFAGGGGNDTIFGLGGNDQLNGGPGDDKLYGGLGDDTFDVDQSKDKVYENKGEGVDTVHSSISFTLGPNLENLTLTGTASINATGNGLNNLLTGNAQNNKLNGGAGNDTLDGGLGNDVLVGGAGNDILTLHRSIDGVTGVDTIQDFAPNKDKIKVSANAFNLTQPIDGSLLASQFLAGKTPQTESQHFIYDKSKGFLYFDPDGSGSQPMTKIGIIGNKAALTSLDFLVET